MAQAQLTFLLDKYKDDKKTLQKINEFMISRLPRLLSTYIEKETRKELLEFEMEKYISAFFTDPRTQFYYIQVSNTFVQYDGKHYQVLNEDIIWHTILSDITAKGVLLDWKYMVKTKILKGIKERPLFSAIPESETIQSVISFLTPGYFNSKEETKYFLTCLGDNILKRIDKTIQLTTPSAKGFIDSIQRQAQYIFPNSININDSFRVTYSYNKECFKQRRLVHINIAQELNEYWHDFLQTNILNLMVVACHYSVRFGGSENYIQVHCHNSEARDYILYLKNKTNDDIIVDFINSYIVKGDEESNSSLNYKDCYFLWNEYLKAFNFPQLMTKMNFFEILVKHLQYDETTSCFPNISSKYLQYVRIFNLFWKETISDASNTQLEISELAMLYNDWLKSRQPGVKFLSEKKIKSIIQYFFPQYNNSKFIHNIECTLWNKNQDIETTLQYLKEWKIVGKESNLTSFYKLYELYCSYGQKKSLKYIVSKKYFENRLRAIIPQNYLSGDAVLADYWKL